MTNGMAPRHHASRIKVLIVDDHAVLRQALRMLLENQPEVEVVGDASNGREALEACEKSHPDVVLMDMVMPGLNGLEATRQIRRRAPKAKVLILTGYMEDEQILAALRAGASGYLLKTMEGEALSRAIHRAVRGEPVVADEMTGKLVEVYRQAATPVAPTAASAPQSGALSPRETDILRGIARGDSNKVIARDLGIAETTVKIHVQHILRKLGVSSRVQVAVIAVERGLI